MEARAMLRDEAEVCFDRFRASADPEALARVYELLVPQLRGMATGLVRDAGQAEDLVQQTFLDAMQVAERYDARRPLLPWLGGILMNQARRLRVQVRRRPRPERLHVGVVDDPARVAAAAEIRERVRSIVAGLPPHYRDVLRMRLLEDMRPYQIAAATGISQDTVKTRLRRGLAVLRGALPEGIVVLLLLGSGVAHDGGETAVWWACGTLGATSAAMVWSHGPRWLLALIRVPGLRLLTAFGVAAPLL